jgi:hypothetical protein
MLIRVLRRTAVVFITSNYVGNSELMQGCKEAGIPAFGTLWDFVSQSVRWRERRMFDADRCQVSALRARPISTAFWFFPRVFLD